MAQPGEAAPGATLRATGVPGARLEQFLALQQDLLLSPDDAELLPRRLVRAVAAFFRARGVALGLLEEGRYRVVAVAGDVPQGALAPTLADGHPETRGDGPERAIIVPMRVAGIAGGLHLVLAGDDTADETVGLARVVAGLAGLAMATAQERRRLTHTGRVTRDVLAAMAHDLRAPLNGLLGYAGLLGDGTFGPLTAEQRDVVSILARQARELGDLVGATLDAAGVESDRLPVRLEQVTIADVVETLRTATFAGPTRDGLVTWSTRPCPPLRTDRLKLKAIVQNLVDNGLKHGRGAAVTVDAGPALDGAALRITVRDRGPGIPAGIMPALFEAFRPGAPGGTGLGLYIVRTFAEALGGSVAAHSAPGEGTTMTVDVPFAAREQATARRSA
jgi:signal transduction histidine kinase